MKILPTNSFILLSLISILTLIQESYAETQAEFKILSPKDLKTDFGKLTDVTLAVGNFGNVPWGRTVIGNLHYADPGNACQPLTPFHQPSLSGSGVTDVEIEAPFVIADRGGCTFVMKASNAQNAGAKLLIVVDDREENENFVLPVDDGHGGGLHIPLILINKRTGELFKEHVKKAGTIPVTISVKFAMPKAISVIEYEIWLSSSDSFSFDLIKDLSKYQDKLGAKAKMTPHYAIWYCPICEISGFKEENNANCLSGGRYCSPDPDGEGPLTGRDTLLEDLRQICIYKESPGGWWDYHKQFSKSCLASARLEQCSYEAINDIGMNKARIEKCVSDSFEGSKRELDDNKILKAERQTFLRRGILTWPSVVINNMTYRGNLEPASYIFEAMCNGFTVQPSECEESNPKPNVPRNGSWPTTVTRKTQSNFWSIVGIIFLATVVFVVLFLCYKRQMKREILQEMNTQIASTMHRYMAMKDDSEGMLGKKTTFAIDH